MAAPELAVIIVSWNTCDLLRRCLHSLERALTGIPAVITVVDNASSDGSAKMVRQEFPACELICLPENRGFARANNHALRRTSAPYVLLLNPDTVIAERATIGRWLTYMQQHPGIAASGCRLEFADGRHQVGDAGFRPCLRSVGCHALLLARLLGPRCRPLFLSGRRPRQPVAVDWVSGAAIMVRQETLRAAGVLDESIFMFAEDIEWGCRMRTAGLRVAYLPHLTITHDQGQAARMRHDRRQFRERWLSNLRAVYARMNPHASIRLYDLLMTAGFCLRMVLYRVLAVIRRGHGYGARARRMAAYAAASWRAVGTPATAR